MDAQKIWSFFKNLHKEVYDEKWPNSNFWNGWNGWMALIASAISEMAWAITLLAQVIKEKETTINFPIHNEISTVWKHKKSTK